MISKNSLTVVVFDLVLLFGCDLAQVSWSVVVVDDSMHAHHCRLIHLHQHWLNWRQHGLEVCIYHASCKFNRLINNFIGISTHDL